MGCRKGGWAGAALWEFTNNTGIGEQDNGVISRCSPLERNEPAGEGEGG